MTAAAVAAAVVVVKTKPNFVKRFRKLQDAASPCHLKLNGRMVMRAYVSLLSVSFLLSGLTFRSLSSFCLNKCTVFYVSAIYFIHVKTIVNE